MVKYEILIKLYIFFNKRGVNSNSDNSMSPDYLQQTSYTVLFNDKICSEYGYENQKTIYCILDTTSRKSNLCSGDSGGPTVYNRSGIFYQFGVAAFVTTTTTGFCDNKAPGFLTAVPSYITIVNGTNQISFPGNWITDYTQLSTTTATTVHITKIPLTTYPIILNNSSKESIKKLYYIYLVLIIVCYIN